MICMHVISKGACVSMQHVYDRRLLLYIAVTFNADLCIL